MRKLVPCLFLIGLGLLPGCKGKSGEAQAAKATEVLVALPIRQVVEEFEEFTGKTEAENSVDVRPRATGYLEKANFEDGSFVKRGDVLFEIDDRPYRADLTRAKAALVQAEARVKRLELDHHRNTEAILTKAISRAEYDKGLGDLDEARANVDVAKANVMTAEYNLGWTRVTAFMSGRISKRRVDPGNLVRADETMLTNIVVTEPYMFATFDIDERTVLRLRSLRRQGRLLLSQDDARMPFLAGSVLGLLAAPAPTKPLLASSLIYPGQLSVLPFKIGLADQDTFPIDAKLNFVDNKIDTGTGTLRVRGEFLNTRFKLHPGLFIRVQLPVGDARPALLVAERALGSDQGQKYIYVVTKESSKENPSVAVDKVAYRQVKLGPLMPGGMRVIEEGVNEGDRVIVNGLQRVRPGTPVTATVVEMTGVLKQLPASGVK